MGVRKDRTVHRAFLICLFVSLAPITCCNAVAANVAPYPNKPVRFIVPSGAGGGTDTVARLVGQKLTERWTYQVVIDNRAGAAGNIAADMAARSAADGHTLFLGFTIHAINASLYPNLTYDLVKDLAPVTIINYSQNILVVHPSVAATTVRELIELARGAPGKWNYASAGSGSPQHLGMEMFKTMANVQLTHVPYKGGPAANNAVLTAEAPILLGSIPTMLPHIRSGRVRALAVSDLKRTRFLPDVPTISESGLSGYELTIWYGMFVPAQTSEAIIKRLHQHVAAIVQLPDIQERFNNLGLIPVGSSPRELAATVKADIDKYRRVIKQSGAKVE